MSAQDTKAGGRMQSAIDELQSLIPRSYPSAQFHVGGSPDDAEIVQFNVIVDVDDLDVVLDTVIDRMMEIQIDDSLPLFVVATRPPQPAAI
jgi:hypothetical protein